MSWFDAAGFATLAKSALNTAQKTIDKALDIREESITSAPTATVTIKPDVDSFFDNFGVGGKTGAPPAKKQHLSTNEKPGSSSQNVGFWSDAWGSFFETKAAAPDPLQTSESSNIDQATTSPKKSTFGKEDRPTVSSQPQRAGLFPGDVKPGSQLQPASLPVVPVCSEKSIASESSKDIPISQKCDTFVAPSDDSHQGVTEIPSDETKASSLDISSASKPPNILGDFQTASSSIQVRQPGEKSDQLKNPESADDNNKPEISEILPDDGCDDISESYVNLENSILNKSAFTNVCSSGADFVDQIKPVDVAESTIVPEVSVQENMPSNLSQSFQVLEESVMPQDSVWVMDMPELCALQDSDHQSQIGDSGSSSSKDDCDIDMKDCDVKSSGSGRSQEMTSSFVKCSIEDVDDGCHRGQSPLSTTTSERSDLTKLESEQNTSGDENETTTSSDIEILSPPNGENCERNTSPLKHAWVPRTIRLRGSESPASDWSKDSMMPIVQEEKDFPQKTYEGIDLEKVLQHQDELQALLEVREKRVLELSTENLKLHESEEKLQNQVRELKLNLARESHNLSSVTKDLTQRLAVIEGQAQKAVKERDLFKTQLEQAQAELAQRVSLTHVEDIIKEKEQQIKELLEEGEKLSKKELQHTTIIKKLRAKENEMEHTMETLKERLDENSKEVERLRKSLGAKDEQEKKHIDAIRQLTNTVTKQEKEIATISSHLEDCKEKELSARKSLESTYKELTELQKKSNVKDKEINELQLSVEMAAQEKFRESLDHATRESSREKAIMRAQMEELRISLKKCESEANQREKSLKEDITRLQLRLQESEARSEELTKNLSSSTRPLVKQIETLQASYNAHLCNWETIEKSLTDRLNDVQNQFLLCSAREKLLNEKCDELSKKSAKLEAENKILQQEKIQLMAELEAINSKLSILEESRNRNSTSVDSLRHNLMLEMNKLKDEKDSIAKELENCIELLKEERMQNQNLQEELRNKENKLDNASHSSSPNASLRSSVDSINNWNQEDTQEKRIMGQLNSYRLSVYDTLTKTGCTTSILENLQSQLKQREGEISQLQCEITKLERERESVAQELVEVTSQNEELLEKLERLKTVEKQHRDLSQKYSALLQMYNEKVEEYEALQLDLADVKSAYRRQIEELLQK